MCLCLLQRTANVADISFPASYAVYYNICIQIHIPFCSITPRIFQMCVANRQRQLATNGIWFSKFLDEGSWLVPTWSRSEQLRWLSLLRLLSRISQYMIGRRHDISHEFIKVFVNKSMHFYRTLNHIMMLDKWLEK